MGRHHAGQVDFTRTVSQQAGKSHLLLPVERCAAPTIWNVFGHYAAMCDSGVRYGPMDLRTNGSLKAQMSPSR